jgi:membrane dipeptidase
MKDASYLPQLADALRAEGFSEEDIEKVFYKNVLRVFKEVCR